MRPEKGLIEEMDENTQDPRELFADIGLLITEARTPDLSPKGRVEGPHCPPISGSNDHVCDRHKEQCRKASDLLRQQDIFWQNKIPMRIDVLLFPECEHGRREETIMEGGSFSCKDSFQLLERWDVQLIKKRSTERMGGFILGRVHLQAIRSYLHFSQLSSWLISGMGSFPLCVVYRVYAPGETIGYNFSQLPEVHKFPSADLGELILSTTVAHLPRSKTPISLLCQSPTTGFEQHLRYKQSLILTNQQKSTIFKDYKEGSPSPSTSKSMFADDGFDLPTASQNIMDCLEAEKSQSGFLKEENVVGLKPPSGKRVENQSKKMKSAMKLQTCPLSKTPKRKVEQMSPTMHSSEKFCFPSADSDGHNAVSSSTSSSSSSTTTKSTSGVNDHPECERTSGKSNMVRVTVADLGSTLSVVTTSPENNSKHQENGAEVTKSSYHIPAKTHMFQKPATLTVSTGHFYPSSKRLPSPKVLVTGTGKPEPTVYKKRCLDAAFEANVDKKSKDFNLAFDELREYTIGEITDLIKPLSPSDLDAYLSSLSNNVYRLGEVPKLSTIPTTKCSFFLGEGVESDETVASSSPKDDVDGKQCQLDKSCEITTKNGTTDNVPVNLKLSKTTGSVKDVVSCEVSDHLIDSNEILVNKSLKNNSLLSKVKQQQSNECHPRHVRNLFKKSFSTSEVNEEIFHHESSSSCTKLQQNEQFQFECSRTEPDPSKPGSVTGGVSQNVIGTKYANQLLCHDGIGNQTASTQSVLNSNGSTSHTSSKSDIVQNFSIPCRTGSSRVSNSMSTLVQDLEAMEIDAEHLENPKITETENSHHNDDKSSHVGSPTLDMEVANHMNSNSLGRSLVAHGNSPSLPSVMSTSPGAATSICDTEQSCDTSAAKRNFSLSLCKQLLRKEFQQTVKNEILCPGQKSYKNLPSPDDISNYHCMMGRSASAIFNISTGLPSRSSPAPVKKKNSSRFDYDCSLTNVRAIKNAISCSKLSLQSENNSDDMEDAKVLSTSAPASTNCLLGNFEESVLNGRIEPVGVVEGFTVEIGAGGLFCPKHVVLPVAAYFFQLSDDNAPSPYLGHVNLEPLGKRGYHIPRTGTVQLTLFNPNKTVVKMFVVLYDLSDMPANCQTFLRQRTIYMPVDRKSSEPSYLRYLIHLRFASSKSGKIYLHTDIRLIFARDKFEFDPKVASYELRSFTEGPQNPKFSPRR